MKKCRSARLYIALQGLRTAAHPNHPCAATRLPRPPTPSGPTAPAGDAQDPVLCVVPDLPTYVKDGFLWAAVQWMVLGHVPEPRAPPPSGAAARLAADARTAAPPQRNWWGSCGYASEPQPQCTCPREAGPQDHPFAAPDQHHNTAVRGPLC